MCAGARCFVFELVVVLVNCGRMWTMFERYILAPRGSTGQPVPWSIARAANKRWIMALLKIWPWSISLDTLPFPNLGLHFAKFTTKFSIQLNLVCTAAVDTCEIRNVTHSTHSTHELMQHDVCSIETVQPSDAACLRTLANAVSRPTKYVVLRAVEVYWSVLGPI